MSGAKIKNSGSDQFVLLPAGLRFGTRDVEIVREGNEVILREAQSRKGSYLKGRKPILSRTRRITPI
jgi:virulence-associated protein VagC